VALRYSRSGVETRTPKALFLMTSVACHESDPGRGGGGTSLRAFTSYEQCMETARGNGAYCVQNPWYLQYGGGLQTERPKRWPTSSARMPRGSEGDLPVRLFCRSATLFLSLRIQEMERIRPIDLVLFITNVNARPSIAHEISSFEDGSCCGIPGEFRMAAARMFTVDREWHWADLFLAADYALVSSDSGSSHLAIRRIEPPERATQSFAPPTFRADRNF